MDRKNKIHDKRKVERSEAIDKTAKIVSGLIPAGSSIYELFTAIIQPLHIQRREEWVKRITLRIYELEKDKKVDLKEISQSEEFNTIITKATLLAQQNHQKVKIESLRAIVLNSATGLSKKTDWFDWADRFLSIINQISPLHILLLRTFERPTQTAKENEVNFDDMISSTNADVFLKIYPTFKEKKDLLNQCWKELYGFGFVLEDAFTDSSNEFRLIHNHGKLIPQVTEFGIKFLEMIEFEVE